MIIPYKFLTSDLFKVFIVVDVKNVYELDELIPISFTVFVSIRLIK